MLPGDWEPWFVNARQERGGDGGHEGSLPPRGGARSVCQGARTDGEGDDLLERRAKQVVLAIVARLAHRSPPDSESRRRRNHGPPKSGMPNRNKTGMHTRLSCKIDYLLRSNHRDRSIAS